MNSNYRAIDIASFFIKKGITPLKLQKLLYYAQLWYYVKHNKKLFNDSIQAWVYGPVVYNVWDNFRFMKRSRVIPHNRALDTDISLVTNHLDDVWNAYGHLMGSDLVDLTHNELPWKNSRKGFLDSQPSGKEVEINNFTTSGFSLNSNLQIPIIISDDSLGRYSNS